MAVNERDPHSGHMTTGHEWNGIKELNTPVPRAVWFFLVVTVIFSIGYWVLMPAWPLGKTYTRGLLDSDQKAIVAKRVDAAAEARSGWTRRIETMNYDQIMADPALNLGELQRLLDDAAGRTVACVGDIMLDRYVYGAVSRE